MKNNKAKKKKILINEYLYLYINSLEKLIKPFKYFSKYFIITRLSCFLFIPNLNRFTKLCSIKLIFSLLIFKNFKLF